MGLEPITPAQGGAGGLVAEPASPVRPGQSDRQPRRWRPGPSTTSSAGPPSRGANGSPVVQPGLQSDPTNCVRYTGSAALTSRKGFPSLCAQPVTEPGRAGRAWSPTSTGSGSSAPRQGRPGRRRAVRERAEPGRSAGAGDPQAPVQHTAVSVTPAAIWMIRPASRRPAQSGTR